MSPTPHPTKVQCVDCHNVYEVAYGRCPLCSNARHQPWIDPHTLPKAEQPIATCGHPFTMKGRAMHEGACPVCLKLENDQLRAELTTMNKGWTDLISRDYVHKTEHQRALEELKNTLAGVKA